ncbi:hypothetical protein FJZ26_05825 [Candidatus Parvarchaeota archaeon]|nr:hypothetical protein [Candidatus Parvarchaeota archaeon]
MIANAEFSHSASSGSVRVLAYGLLILLFVDAALLLTSAQDDAKAAMGIGGLGIAFILLFYLLDRLNSSKLPLLEKYYNRLSLSLRQNSFLVKKERLNIGRVYAVNPLYVKPYLLVVDKKGVRIVWFGLFSDKPTEKKLDASCLDKALLMDTVRGKRAEIRAKGKKVFDIYWYECRNFDGLVAALWKH